MASKNNKDKIVVAAYCQVNNVLKKDVNGAEHQKIISTALTEVWSYDGLYPGENDKLKVARLEMDSPADGEYSELAIHFRKLYPDEFEELSAPAVIFSMYNRMKDLGTKSEAEPAESVAAEPEVTESSDTSNKSFIKEEEKETKIMSEQKHLLNLGDVEAQMNGTTGADITINGAMPVQASKATLDAVADKFNETAEKRKQYTAKTTIEKLVVGSPCLKDRLVSKDEVIYGTIKEPEKVKASFVKKFDVKVDENGAVTFGAVAAGSEADALQLYNDICAACEDPSKQFAVKVGDSMGTIKGVQIMEAGEQSARLITMAELTDILINKAMYVLNTPDPEVQAQVAKARSSQSTATSGSGIQKTKKTNKNPYAGVASVKVIGRNKAGNMVTYHKTMTDEKDILGGLKSEVSAKYYKGSADQLSEKKVLTFRIPLQAEQFVTKVDDPAMLAAFGAGTGLAGTQVAIDINDESALNAIANDIIGAIADAAATGREGKLFDAIRESAANAEQASADKQAEDFGGLE